MPLMIRETITATFLERVAASPGLIGFQYKPTYSEMGTVGQWKEVSFKGFYQECRLASYGLMGLGVLPGDKIALISNTRYEWSLCDMATLGAAAVTVPLYASSSANDLVYMIEHSEARVVILEDSSQLKKILDKDPENSGWFSKVEKIIVLEPTALNFAMRVGMSAQKEQSEFTKKILTFRALQELGRREEAKNPKRFDENLRNAKPEDLIAICYTSGTTGIPKGVMITHANLMSVLEDCVKVFGVELESGQSKPEEDREVILSILPFSHIFGKVESMAIYPFGWRQVFAESADRLMANMAEIEPTLIFSVPRIFEKAYHLTLIELDRLRPIKRSLHRWAYATGRRYYDALWNRRSPALSDMLEYRAARRLILRNVVRKFGRRLKFAICGGAPLPPEIGRFFQIHGITILEGYGLTETCAPVAINVPSDVRFETVGRPLPEVSFKIAEDGEILVKSKKVFSSYYKMSDETSQALRGGWLYTGDIGHLDSDGFLHITDRKKDLIVTSAGKNIAPQKIENIAKAQKVFNHFVVHGDRRHYLTALITLHRDQIVQYAHENQILFSEYAELIKNPKILSLAQKGVDEINKQLASFESIKKFVILPEDLSVERGDLTPSLKVRRKGVNQRYKAELDSMYGDSVRIPLDSGLDIR